MYRYKDTTVEVLMDNWSVTKRLILFHFPCLPLIIAVFVFNYRIKVDFFGNWISVLVHWFWILSEPMACVLLSVIGRISCASYVRDVMEDESWMYGGVLQIMMKYCDVWWNIGMCDEIFSSGPCCSQILSSWAHKTKFPRHCIKHSEQEMGFYESFILRSGFTWL